MNFKFLPETKKKEDVLFQFSTHSLGIQVVQQRHGWPESQLLFAFEKRPFPLIFEMKKAEIVKVCVCPLKGKDLLPFSNGPLSPKE